MKPIRLLAQMALWMACLAAFNVAVQKLSRTSIPRQVARSIDTSGPVTDLFVGNSLVAAAIDAEAFAKAHPGRHALNIGLGSSYPAEHNILLRRSLKLHPGRVYYGFFDRQLIDPAKGGWGDLVGNRAMAYYMNLELAIRFYAADDPLGAGMMRVIARIPMIVERYAIWVRIEKLRRRLGEIGLEKQATNRFGRADDFGLLEATDASHFLNNIQRAVDTHAEFVPAITDMIQVLREQEIPLILVEMPMHSGHRKRFYDHAQWKHARQYFADKVRRAGCVYIDASDWIRDDQFADKLHLNPEGAAEFSRRIGSEADQASRSGQMPISSQDSK